MRSQALNYLLGIVAFLSLSADSAVAVTLNATDQGFYTTAATPFDPANQYIYAGSVVGGAYRNYFTFDLSSLAGQTVTAATLSINGGYYSVSGADAVYRLHGYAGSIPDLVTGNVDFLDLGSGDIYGGFVAPITNITGTTFVPMFAVNIAFNNTGLADINALLNSSDLIFAITGVCGSGICEAEQANILWATIPTDLTIPTVQLSLEVAEVPLPAALPLYGTGLGVMGLFGWWRRRRASRNRLS